MEAITDEEEEASVMSVAMQVEEVGEQIEALDLSVPSPWVKTAADLELEAAVSGEIEFELEDGGGASDAAAAPASELEEESAASAVACEDAAVEVEADVAASGGIPFDLARAVGAVGAFSIGGEGPLSRPTIFLDAEPGTWWRVERADVLILGVLLNR